MNNASNTPSIEDYRHSHMDGLSVTTRRAVLEHAEDAGHYICKFSDPTEGEIVGMSVDAAMCVVQEDPSLVWIQTDVG